MQHCGESIWSIYCLFLHSCLKSTDGGKKGLRKTWGQQPELHSLCIAQLMTGWRPCRKDGGGLGRSTSCTFLHKSQIDSIRRRETGEGGRQATEDDKTPRAGHSTLSKLFRLWLLDEWSALWACIPFARMRFSFTGAYRTPYLTSLLSPTSVFTGTQGTKLNSTALHD